MGGLYNIVNWEAEMKYTKGQKYTSENNKNSQTPVLADQVERQNPRPI